MSKIFLRSGEGKEGAQVEREPEALYRGMPETIDEAVKVLSHPRYWQWKIKDDLVAKFPVSGNRVIGIQRMSLPLPSFFLSFVRSFFFLLMYPCDMFVQYM